MECNTNAGSTPTRMEFHATGAGLHSIRFLNSNWDDSMMSMDHTDPFQSCLSSIVSSPVAPIIGTSEGDHGMVKELIGRLEVIHDSGDEMSRFHHRSSNTTPLNSPSKPGVSLMDLQIGGNYRITGNQLPPQSQQSSFPFSDDPRAVRLSCFGSRRSSFGEAGDSREGSSLSEQITGGQMTNTKARNDTNVGKRKLAQRGKSKDSNVAAKNSLGAGKDNQPNPKKMKSGEETGNGSGVDCDQSARKVNQGEKNQKKHQKDGKSKQPEPPKDYIHVRARRGEATDSHSLAERVRREKISQRMKVLQDLVPGCNKVTGKAIMLDEIINYVQSLQNQVEFLSMKLATFNPRKDLDLEALLSKDMFHSPGSSAYPVFPLDIISAPSFPHRCLPSHGMNMAQSDPEIHLPNNPLNAMVHKLHGFPMAPSQVSSVWEDDHHNLIQTGIAQHNQPLSLYGSSEPTHPQTKVEW